MGAPRPSLQLWGRTCLGRSILMAGGWRRREMAKMRCHCYAPAVCQGSVLPSSHPQSCGRTDSAQTSLGPLPLCLHTGSHLGLHLLFSSTFWNPLVDFGTFPVGLHLKAYSLGLCSLPGGEVVMMSGERRPWGCRWPRAMGTSTFRRLVSYF